MDDAEITRLEERREALLAEFRDVPDLMRGKISERYVKCGRPSCTCASGGPRHPNGIRLVRRRVRLRREGGGDSIMNDLSCAGFVLGVLAGLPLGAGSQG